jgi:hypothetical protein
MRNNHLSRILNRQLYTLTQYLHRFIWFFWTLVFSRSLYLWQFPIDVDRVRFGKTYFPLLPFDWCPWFIYPSLAFLAAVIGFILPILLLVLLWKVSAKVNWCFIMGFMAVMLTWGYIDIAFGYPQDWRTSFTTGVPAENSYLRQLMQTSHFSSGRRKELPPGRYFYRPIHYTWYFLLCPRREFTIP